MDSVFVYVNRLQLSFEIAPVVQFSSNSFDNFSYVQTHNQLNLCKAVKSPSWRLLTRHNVNLIGLLVIFI